MRHRVAVIAVVATLVVACADGSATPDGGVDAPVDGAPQDRRVDPEPPPSAPPSPPAPPDATGPVPRLLDFTSPAVDGGQVVGSEFAGQALAVWFWAPW